MPEQICAVADAMADAVLAALGMPRVSRSPAPEEDS